MEKEAVGKGGDAPVLREKAKAISGAAAVLLVAPLGIRQAAWLVFSSREVSSDRARVVAEIERTFSYPVFVKPASTGSSVGINKSKTRDDLLAHLAACADGTLADEEIEFSSKCAVTVIMASGGYPEAYKSHYPIMGKVEKGSMVFHCGTAFEDGQIVTAGGRVLAVTANAEDIEQAREDVYDAVGNIFFEDCYYRNDIACDLLSLAGFDED